MITIAIVEDQEEFAEMLREKAARETDWGEPVSVDCYQDPLAFLERIEGGESYEVGFVDVRMPGLDGVTLAHRLRQAGSRMLIVFVSSYAEYASDGYGVSAFDYLLKDRLDGKWDAFVLRARKALADSRGKMYAAGTKNRMEQIVVGEILYITHQGKYTIFHMPGREARVRKPLQKVADELKIYRQFVQVKRGIIVNIEKIRTAAAREIVMENGECIAVGRMRVEEVREQIHAYLRERI